MIIWRHLLLLATIFCLSSSSSLFACQTTAPAATQTKAVKPKKRRMSPELLWKMGRLGEAAVAPSGEEVVYAVRHYDLAKNKGRSSLHRLNLKTYKDIEIIKDWSTISSIQWITTDKGPRVYFIGKQGASKDAGDEDAKPAPEFPQAWSWNPADSKMLQVTNIPDGIANLKVSPTGKHLAFTLDVKMDKTVNELYEDLPLADARIIDGLMYRHWNAWHDYAYTHLHVAPVNDDGKAGKAKDLMPDVKADCPVPPFGGAEQFNWAPDGTEIAYTMKDEPKWAESTNSDVFIVSVTGDQKAKNISEGMLGYDNDPVYSPDGKMIAFHSMERASFESDRNRVMVMNRETGEIIDATRGLDQTAHSATWLPDSKGFLFMSEHRGTNQIFKTMLDSPSTTQVSSGKFNFSLIDVLPDGKTALVSRQNMLRPNELAVLTLADATNKRISKINDEIYANLDLPKIEERWVDATDGKKIHCWVIHPPEFDPKATKKWPMLTYCQGGPQGQIGQWFSFRWNFHLMASKGYVVVAPNRRGLPGFGREWNDQISGDWGGQAMKDLLSATDNMTAEPYIDEDRVAAVGASFGGYTVYWMMGNHRDRFCSMIAHCGVFNLESMYGATEELFFVNWDLGGPYWKSPEIQQEYQKFSPHKFVGKWKTPLMVIHGEKDFRVPVTQGMEAFTAAQVQGVESRFLYYPEEGHWVQSPQNGVLWHRVFFDWLDRYCKPSESETEKAN